MVGDSYADAAPVVPEGDTAEVAGAAEVAVPDTSDAALASRAAQGDAAAFEVLLRRYQDRVFGLAVRMLGDRAEAEDIAQEVFITAWRRLSDLHDPGAVRTWLFCIAQRQCLGLFRKRRRHPTDPTDPIPDMVGVAVGAATPTVALDPQRAAEVGAGVRALRVALGGLPAPQRAVWVLAEVDGLPFAEIARRVGTTEQAVRGRLCRARAKLANLMRAWR